MIDRKQISHILLILMFVIGSLPVFSYNINVVKAAYTISGDKVFIDDAKVYLSASPHTLVESGWVEFNLISKVFTGSIDALWGFNSSNGLPKRAEIWDGSKWNPLNKDITIINHDFMGYDRWYLLSDVNVNQGVLYKVRVWMNVVFNTSGKYWFGIKPHAETLQQAIASNHFYYLDPWWHSGWGYRRTITINQVYVDARLRNFPVMVKITGDSDMHGKCQADGDDIRFVDYANTTVFKYERVYWEYENITNTVSAVFFVNVTDIRPTVNTLFNMYFGNASAVDGEDAVGTWTQQIYGGVYHMEEGSGNLTDSTGSFDFSRAGTPTYSSSGQVSDSVYLDASGDYFGALSNFSMQDGGGWSIWFKGVKDYGEGLVSVPMNWANRAAAGIMNSNGSMRFITLNLTVNEREIYATGNKTAGNWGFHSCVYNYTGHKQEIYTNGSFVKSCDRYGLLRTDYQRVFLGVMSASLASGANNLLGYYDELRMYKKEVNSSWIKAEYAGMNCSTSFITLGSIYSSTTLPSGFLANTTGYTSMVFNWTKGDSSTHTHIRYSSSTYPTSITEGTLLYNDTGTNTGVNVFSAYNNYFFSAWGYNSTTNGYTAGYAVATNHTGPLNPTNVVSSLAAPNIVWTWTKGLRADMTVLVRKDTGYPTSASDGVVVSNTSGTTASNAILPKYFYMLFSYNNATHLYSSGTPAEWGSFSLNCYSEDDNTPLNFDVFITDFNGIDTYEQYGCTNTEVIDIDDTPMGFCSVYIVANTSYDTSTETFYGYNMAQNETTTFIQLEYEPESVGTTNVTCYNTSDAHESYPPFILSGNIITIYPEMADMFSQINVTYTYKKYNSRLYYMVLEANTFYTLNAYLPSVYKSKLYQLTVVGEQYEYGTSPPVENASVTIKKYINASYGYRNISILQTDANGQCNLYLIPGTFYNIMINKTGYTNTVTGWVPDDIILTKTFRLYFTIPTVPGHVDFMDTITFKGTMYTNNTIRVEYVDKGCTTLDAQIYLYEMYGGNLSLLGSSSFITCTYVMWNGSINTSRSHLAVLYWNNTVDFDINSPYAIIIPFINLSFGTNLTKIDVDDIISDVIGPAPIGNWATIISVFIALVLLMSFGPYNTGLGIIGAGMGLGLTQAIFAMMFTNSISLLLVLLCPFCLIIGIIYFLTKGNVEDKL